MSTVVGLFHDRTSAESAINRLLEDGVARDSISIAMKDAKEASALSDATGTNDLSSEGATAGLVSGAGVGALVGIALVGSTVLLPGLIGGLIGAGIPEDEAEHYAAGIEKGGIFVSANVPDGQVAEARRIFDEEGSSRTYAP